jgi:hypothetical protein
MEKPILVWNAFFVFLLLLLLYLFLQGIEKMNGIINERMNEWMNEWKIERHSCIPFSVLYSRLTKSGFSFLNRVGTKQNGWKNIKTNEWNRAYYTTNNNENDLKTTAQTSCARTRVIRSHICTLKWPYCTLKLQCRVKMINIQWVNKCVFE